MAKKKAAKPKSGLMQTRPTEEQWSAVVTYCHDHDLSVSEFARLGILRALKKQPTKTERDEIQRPSGFAVGDPSSAGRAGAESRWKEKRKGGGNG